MQALCQTHLLFSFFLKKVCEHIRNEWQGIQQDMLEQVCAGREQGNSIAVLVCKLLVAIHCKATIGAGLIVAIDLHKVCKGILL